MWQASYRESTAAVINALRVTQPRKPDVNSFVLDMGDNNNSFERPWATIRCGDEDKISQSCPGAPNLKLIYS
jgi:hypothetical protein